MTPETINAAVGDEFEVRLNATPSTGYVWKAQTLPEGVQLLGSDYERPSANSRPGDPTAQVFRFRASRAGDYTINIVLKRPWESDAVQSRTVSVKIN